MRGFKSSANSGRTENKKIWKKKSQWKRIEQCKALKGDIT